MMKMVIMVLMRIGYEIGSSDDFGKKFTLLDSDFASKFFINFNILIRTF